MRVTHFATGNGLTAAARAWHLFEI
jgi:hypothetical protein